MACHSQYICFITFPQFTASICPWLPIRPVTAQNVHCKRALDFRLRLSLFNKYTAPLEPCCPSWEAVIPWSFSEPFFTRFPLYNIIVLRYNNLHFYITEVSFLYPPCEHVGLFVQCTGWCLRSNLIWISWYRRVIRSRVHVILDDKDVIE